MNEFNIIVYIDRTVFGLVEEQIYICLGGWEESEQKNIYFKFILTILHWGSQALRDLPQKDTIKADFYHRQCQGSPKVPGRKLLPRISFIFQCHFRDESKSSISVLIFITTEYQKHCCKMAHQRICFWLGGVLKGGEESRCRSTPDVHTPPVVCPKSVCMDGKYCIVLVADIHRHSR